MSTSTFGVAGLTCGHCVSAVTEEISALDGVSDVRVDLVSGGVSTVTITAAAEITDEAVAAAVDEAGDYRLADLPA
ncbi:heavy-metal-associated domain-containing protein [Brachybacterium sp. DNPG3]